MTVVLVGAGPGDPDLLTVRAARAIAAADVILVDRLVDRRVLQGAKATATIVDVGKLPRTPSSSTSQDAINALLIKHARDGASVVRLKGGDPFVFGRGAEEVAALVDADVDVEVIPGLTSALAIPGLAGIPVTERGVASAVTIVAGQRLDDDENPWGVMAAPGHTVVLLMAVANRGQIASRLMRHGRAPSTPVAVIERGATPRERRIATTLDALRDVEVDAPAVIVIGPVASHMAPLEHALEPMAAARGVAHEMLCQPSHLGTVRADAM